MFVLNSDGGIYMLLNLGNLKIFTNSYQKLFHKKLVNSVKLHFCIVPQAHAFELEVVPCRMLNNLTLLYSCIFGHNY